MLDLWRIRKHAPAFIYDFRFSAFNCHIRTNVYIYYTARISHILRLYVTSNEIGDDALGLISNLGVRNGERNVRIAGAEFRTYNLSARDPESRSWAAWRSEWRKIQFSPKTKHKNRVLSELNDTVVRRIGPGAARNPWQRASPVRRIFSPSTVSPFIRCRSFGIRGNKKTHARYVRHKKLGRARVMTLQ